MIFRKNMDLPKSPQLSSVPAFAIELEKPIEVEGVGTVTVDMSHSSMAYADVNAL